MTADRRFGFELFDQVGLGLMGRMNAEMGQIKEERSILVTLDEIDRPVSEKVGQVRPGRIVRLGIGAEVEVPAHGNDGFVEPASAGVIVALFTEMPFAEHPRSIAGFFHGLGNRHAIQWQLRDIVYRPQGASLPVEAVDLAHGIYPGARAVLPAHQRGTRRLAILTMMMARQTQPLVREPIDVRRFIVFAAVARHVRVTEIVGQNEDHVGFLRRASLGAVHSACEYQQRETGQ